MKKLKYILIFWLMVSCEEILLEEDILESEVELLAPIGRAVVETSAVNLSWSTVDGAVSYKLQIASPDFEAPTQVISVSVEESHYIQDLGEGDYEWRVKAINSGFETLYSTAEFQVNYSEEFADQFVVLISPPDQFVSKNEEVELTWSAIEESELYRVQLYTKGEIVKEEIVSGTSIQISFPEGKTVWKVRAENEAQHTLYSERTLIVDTKMPLAPMLVSPADKWEVSNPAVSFEWEREAVAGTEEVDSLFVFADADLEMLVEKAQVNLEYNLVLERDSTYYWYMRAYDQAGNQSEDSEVFSFTIN